MNKKHLRNFYLLLNEKRVYFHFVNNSHLYLTLKNKTITKKFFEIFLLRNPNFRIVNDNFLDKYNISFY